MQVFATLPELHLEPHDSTYRLVAKCIAQTADVLSKPLCQLFDGTGVELRTSGGGTFTLCMPLHPVVVEALVERVFRYRGHAHASSVVQQLLDAVAAATAAQGDRVEEADGGGMPHPHQSQPTHRDREAGSGRVRRPNARAPTLTRRDHAAFLRGVDLHVCVLHALAARADTVAARAARKGEKKALRTAVGAAVGALQSFVEARLALFQEEGGTGRVPGAFAVVDDAMADDINRGWEAFAHACVRLDVPARADAFRAWAQTVGVRPSPRVCRVQLEALRRPADVARQVLDMRSMGVSMDRATAAGAVARCAQEWMRGGAGVGVGGGAGAGAEAVAAVPMPSPSEVMAAAGACTRRANQRLSDDSWRVAVESACAVGGDEPLRLYRVAQRLDAVLSNQVRVRSCVWACACLEYDCVLTAALLSTRLQCLAALFSFHARRGDRVNASLVYSTIRGGSHELPGSDPDAADHATTPSFEHMWKQALETARA